jgi:acetyltransferase
MTVSSDLLLAKFEQETIDDLASHLPLTANIHNPVDIIGDAPSDRYEHALRAVIKDKGVDGALVILTPQSMTNALGTAQAIDRVARGAQKPIICCFMGIVDVSAGVKYLQENGYPVYRFPENAAKAFGVLYRYSRWLNRDHLPQFTLEHDRDEAASVIARCLAQGKVQLGEMDSVELLKCYGFSLLPSRLAKNEDEAADIGEGMTFPVVMKIASAQILHKTDAKGVVLGIKSKDDAKKAFREIIENARNFRHDAVIDGVMVQKMAMQGEELILGMNRTPLGPLLMFGLGGVFVELFQDVVFRLAPILRNETHRMVQEIRGYKLLMGFRGRPKADIEAIEKAVISLSNMAVNHPEIKEMDINPLIVHEQGKGTTVADCRIILEAVGDIKR